MDLRDDIAALPGGGRVVSALDRVNRVDSGILSGLTRRWQQAAGQCATSGAAVTRAARRLEGQWTGATATAFTDYTHRLTDAGSALSEVLTQAADAADQAVAAIAYAQSQAATRCEWLLADAKSWRMANPAASDDQDTDTISRLCRQTAAEVGDLAGTVDGSLAALSGTFERLSGREKPYDPINPPGGLSITVVYSVPDYPQAAGALARPEPGTLAAPLGQRAATAAIPAVRGGMMQALSPMRRASFTPMVRQSPLTDQSTD
ncbi:WXG100 family type VII secretion target [Amycolatopsis pigmentata]|uniref:WXG100 family type VII secretion target n=1 Tax=Amycolatopsis pigmentata TaxID=450801 RepID=A0ABW5FVX7_9PSEU